MQLDFKWSRLDALSALECFEMLKAREAVFVVEQKCAYQEADQWAPEAWLLRVLLKGQFAAYLRVIAPGMKYAQASIGRVMTVKAFRKLTIGRALMCEGIRFTEQTFPTMGIQISAQLHLEAFYASLGFEVVSKPYEEDGILHLDMLKSADWLGDLSRWS